MTKNNSLYDHDEVYEATLKYFQNDTFAAGCFVDKYALKDKAGNYIERTPDDMHHRLASEYARIEAKYPNAMSEDEIYNLFKKFTYVVPAGSPMSGIGNKSKVQSISNCFVINSPSDSFGGICRADEEMQQIMKRRGGVGTDISNIRPKGLPTANAAQTTDGIEVFMEQYSNSCERVAQGGRRGALMLSLSCHHPEIMKFITIKDEKHPITNERYKVTGANVSIRLTDEFMHAVENNTDMYLRFPVDPDADHIVSEKIDAAKLWNAMTETARNASEPGALFWDTIIRRSPADCYASLGYRSTSLNPCGEIPMAGGGNCSLMSMNLSSFVNHPFQKEASFDYELFAKMVRKAQRLMDDQIDLELEAVDRIIKKVESDPELEADKDRELKLWKNIRRVACDTRRTGLGVTALGDVIAYMGFKYGEPDAVDFVSSVFKSLALNAYYSSCEMAGERGPFPIFSHELEKDHEFLNQIWDAAPDVYELYQAHGRRNIGLTTTAPNGTLSFMTQTTAGIEPPISLKGTRRRKIIDNSCDKVDFVDPATGCKYQEYEFTHPGLCKWTSITGLNEKDSPYLASKDIHWKNTLAVQSAAQKWICHSISITYNLPNDVDVGTIRDIFLGAWKQGCKGVTIYREGSRAEIVVTSKFKQHVTPSRSKELECNIHNVTIKGEAWTILVGLMEGKPYEIFGGFSSMIEIPKKYKQGKIVKYTYKTRPSSYDLTSGEGDDCFKIKDIIRVFDNPTEGSFTRTISLALRTGAPVADIVDQLQKGDKDSDMFSFTRVMTRVLKQYVPNGTQAKAIKTCPQCNVPNALAYQEGCVVCTSCGWSACS